MRMLHMFKLRHINTTFKQRYQIKTKIGEDDEAR